MVPTTGWYQLDKFTIKNSLTCCHLNRRHQNSVSSDLQFTTECPEEFPECKLPTLDFKLWITNSQILHTYFEKEMRTPFVTMKKSAMGEQQRMAILSNELVRRLSNISLSIVGEELLGVVEHYTTQLKQSGYERKQAKEIVCSGVTGWQRKVQRREREGRGYYRLGSSTLKDRTRKKLLEKTTWYRPKRRAEDADGEEERYGQRMQMDRGGGDAQGERIVRKMMKKFPKVKDDGKKSDIKAVMFVPFTMGSKLAKSLRDAEEKLCSITGYRLKVVEKAGDKLEDLLAKSNPWQGMDCGREACLL